MPPPSKKPVEHHIGHTGEEIAALEKQIEDLQARLSAIEHAPPPESHPASDAGLDGRVRALEEWRHALRKHTHQFLHDTGWKEPQ